MENSIYQGGNNAFLHFTDGAGHPGLSVHPGSLPRARHGGQSENKCFVSLWPHVWPSYI